MKLTRFWGAFALAVSVYSLLFWFYIVLRVVVDHVGLYNRFIDSVPFFTFFNLGIFTFLLSFAALVAYLATRSNY